MNGKLGIKVIGVSTIHPDELDLGSTTVAEWGITGFPNIADDGEVHARFDVVAHPTAVAVSAGGSLASTTEKIDVQSATELITRARARDG
ncbi:MAG: hypothetical protein MK196_06025 [Acidimicrobiales bacterium]|nr:hypothetical protein [Acidimicrobiales bacterium]